MSNEHQRREHDGPLHRFLGSDEYALARIMFLILALTLAFGIREALGGEYDVSKPVSSHPTYSSVVTEGTGLYMGAGSTTPDSSWSTQAVSITDGGQLVLGINADNDAARLTLTLRSVTFVNSGLATAPGLRIVASTDNYNGTALSLSTLDIAAGGTVAVTQGVANAEAGWNKLVVGTLNAAAVRDGAVTVESNALLSVTSSAYTVLGSAAAAVDLNLGSGGNASAAAHASFAGGLDVVQGDIVASAGHGNLAVGSGSAGLIFRDGDIEASGGHTLNILAEIGKADLGNALLGSNSGNVVVRVDGGSTVNMGDLETRGVVTVDGATGTNKLNLKTLTVKGELIDDADVDTSVSGLTAIDGAGNRYVVAGLKNVYAGGIDVLDGGVLTSTNSGATITVTNGVVNLDGGVIAGGAGAGTTAFAIDATVVNVTGDDASALDATGGAIDLSKALVKVAAPGGVDIVANHDITVGGYNQSAGVVDAGRTAGTGRFIVADRAVIGGGAAATTFRVSDDATHFQGGATVGPRAAVAAAANSDAVVTFGKVVGSTASAGDLILAGGGTLSAGANATLTLRDAYGYAGANNAARSRVLVQGSGNNVTGDVDTTKMNVVVSGENATTGSALRVRLGSGTTGFTVNSLTVNGGETTLGDAASAGVVNSRGNVLVNANGALASENSNSRINNVGAAANRLVLAKDASITTRAGDLTVNNFASVDIGSKFVGGWNATTDTTHTLYANSNVAITSTGSIGLTGEAALHARAGDVLIDVTSGTGVITSNAVLAESSMFGDYGFAIESAGRQRLIVSSVANQIAGDYSAADIARAVANLRLMWGHRQIGDDLGNIIYQASVEDGANGYGIVADPTNNVPGNKNIAIFQALASPSGKVVGRDTLEYVNGAHNFGVADVALSTSNMLLSELDRRSKAAGCQVLAVSDFASDAALASDTLADPRYSRAWIGGFGTRDKVKGKQDFSGYKYNSTGFMAGYDIVAKPNLVVGAAFAYAKGDYSDLGAVDSDSTIESYSGALYGTYSLPFGLYVSASGGYTYSDNSIEELRRDPSISDYSWATADYDGHTWMAGANVGWDARLGNFTVTPSVGVSYAETRGRDHTSYLGGVATQRERDMKMKALYMPVDLNVRYDMMFGETCGVRFEGNAGYTRNFKTDGIEGDIVYNGVVYNDGFGSPVSSAMRSQEQEKATYRFGAGVRYLYEKFDIGVKYDYLTSGKRDAHRVAASAGVKF